MTTSCFCRDGQSDRAALASIIRGKLLLLSLPPFYETVSSTRIRASSTRTLIFPCSVAPVVQTYIYECGLYVRSPEQKDVLRREALYFRNVTQDEHTPPAGRPGLYAGQKSAPRGASAGKTCASARLGGGTYDFAGRSV